VTIDGAMGACQLRVYTIEVTVVNHPAVPHSDLGPVESHHARIVAVAGPLQEVANVNPVMFLCHVN
jgi:hypothetical protein